ncbi:MAG TPA: HEPN domain-containing protein [bacterium]|nr:HEPN domain-containing protein [bacterium]
MKDREEALRLLFAAEKDIAALRGMMDLAVFAEEIFGFHAQQAVEKSLKALLALLGRQYPRTHDLSLLMSQLSSSGEIVEEFIDLLELNSYAVQFRYEAFDESDEGLDREQVVDRVTALAQSVRNRID